VILTGASTLGVPVKDTIKIISDNDKIKETPNRNFLRAVQTPQVFSKEQYLENIKTAAGFSEEFTDDCQLFERCGCTVTIVEGLYTNIKLTTQEDVKLAESILESRGNCENRTRV
jgi:2-C-methyl-D-erythritol 4-phosphate cytidylyltransferase